jgi:DNA-binding NarL/FixJ family response regulator
MKPYSVVLADDHPLMREGLRMILSTSPMIKVLGEAGDGLELLKLLGEVSPDMIILDVSMPNLRGLEAISEIKAIYPNMKILMLSMHRNVEYLNEAISSGANGYLLKEDAHHELFSAIERISQGKKYMSPRFAEDLADEWMNSRSGEVKSTYEVERLTTREKEILKLIAEGKTARQIAGMLFISNRTVEHHRHSVMKKIKAKKTADLIKYAVQKGYV